MDGHTSCLLDRAARGDHEADARLTDSIYEQLRKLAYREFAKLPAGNALMLQPTALVHEAFLKLVGNERLEARSRTHFFAIAATTLRRALIDHLRMQRADKRGGSWQRLTLCGISEISPVTEPDFELLNEYLHELASLDGRAARVVELRFLADMPTRDVALALGVSERTVRDDWSFARAWLHRKLSEEQ